MAQNPATPLQGDRVPGIVETIVAPPKYLFRVNAWDILTGDIYLEDVIMVSTTRQALELSLTRSLPDAAMHDDARDLQLSVQEIQVTKRFN